MKKINEITTRLDQHDRDSHSLVSMRPSRSIHRRVAGLFVAVLALQVAASRASVDDAQSFALRGGGALRQGRLPGPRRLLGRRPRRGGKEGRPPAAVQRQRILVLDRHRGGAGQGLGSHLRLGRQAGGAEPTAGRKATSPRRISFPRRPAAISSSSRSTDRRRSARIGRWFTVSTHSRSRLTPLCCGQPVFSAADVSAAR